MWIESFSIVVITIAAAIACSVGSIVFLQLNRQAWLHPKKRALKSIGNHSGFRNRLPAAKPTD